MFVTRFAFDALREARFPGQRKSNMSIPSEYGWTLIAIGGACATTIFGSIKVRIPQIQNFVERTCLQRQPPNRT